MGILSRLSAFLFALMGLVLALIYGFCHAVYWKVDNAYMNTQFNHNDVEIVVLEGHTISSVISRNSNTPIRLRDDFFGLEIGDKPVHQIRDEFFLYKVESKFSHEDYLTPEYIWVFYEINDKNGEKIEKRIPLYGVFKSFEEAKNWAVSKNCNVDTGTEFKLIRDYDYGTSVYIPQWMQKKGDLSTIFQTYVFTHSYDIMGGDGLRDLAVLRSEAEGDSPLYYEIYKNLLEK